MIDENDEKSGVRGEVFGGAARLHVASYFDHRVVGSFKISGVGGNFRWGRKSFQPLTLIWVSAGSLIVI